MSTEQLIKAKWSRLPVTDSAFLEEWELEKTWAPKNGIHKRTSQSYRNKKRNGLPFMIWGGQVWINKLGGAEFMRTRMRQRNRQQHSTRKFGKRTPSALVARR